MIIIFIIITNWNWVVTRWQHSLHIQDFAEKSARKKIFRRKTWEVKILFDWSPESRFLSEMKETRSGLC